MGVVKNFVVRSCVILLEDSSSGDDFVTYE